MYQIFVNSQFEIYIYVYMHIHIHTCLQERRLKLLNWYLFTRRMRVGLLGAKVLFINIFETCAKRMRSGRNASHGKVCILPVSNAAPRECLGHCDTCSKLASGTRSIFPLRRSFRPHVEHVHVLAAAAGHVPHVSRLVKTLGPMSFKNPVLKNSCLSQYLLLEI